MFQLLMIQVMTKLQFHMRMKYGTAVVAIVAVYGSGSAVTFFDTNGVPRDILHDANAGKIARL